jgi:hypothetical protein
VELVAVAADVVEAALLCDRPGGGVVDVTEGLKPTLVTSADGIADEPDALAEESA